LFFMPVELRGSDNEQRSLYPLRRNRAIKVML